MEYATVYEFTKRKIAHIIYETVEWHGEGDRSAVDWERAERILLAAPVIVDNLLPYCAGEDLDYAAFERRLGGMIWARVEGKRGDLPRPPYGKIKFGLGSS